MQNYIPPPPPPPPSDDSDLESNSLESTPSENIENPNKLKILVWIGLGLNIVAWIMGTSSAGHSNYNIVWVGVFLCVLGGILCFVGKNKTLAILCLVDAYLLYDLINSYRQIDSILNY